MKDSTTLRDEIRRVSGHDRRREVTVDSLRVTEGDLRRGEGRGVEANERLTAMTAIVLLLLLLIEGLTVLRIGRLLTVHVFMGVVLIPPITLKVASTLWRFVRYYAGAPDYRRKGPPPFVLRALGPFVIMLTAVLMTSGVVLTFGPTSWRSNLLVLHRASFILWFGVMAVHVVGHLLETGRLGPRDWVRRGTPGLRGTVARRAAVLLSVVAGVMLAALSMLFYSGWSLHG